MLGFFGEQFNIEQIICPLQWHSENGKIECRFRTIDERLRTNKQIFLIHDKSGMSGSFYALRLQKKSETR